MVGGWGHTPERRKMTVRNLTEDVAVGASLIWMEKKQEKEGDGRERSGVRPRRDAGKVEGAGGGGGSGGSTARWGGAVERYFFHDGVS